MTAIALTPIPAIAQSIVPGTDTNTRVTQTGNQFDIDGGMRSLDGANLFHTFESFGLTQAQIANFLANPGLQNILTRITGGDASVIDGLLQVSGGEANLFLMNPAGVIFGENARLNVGADFMATTAHGIGVGSGWFSATGSNDYGALLGNPDRLAVTTTGSLVNGGVLQVPDGHSLSLVGGTVINTGTLLAPEGQVVMLAMPDDGVLELGGNGYSLSLNVGNGLADASNPLPFSPASLPQLLAGLDPTEATGLTVNPDGTVMLTRSQVQVPTDGGVAIASNTLSTAGSVGGTVQVLGDRVGLIDGVVNVSGMRGGGLALIGGDYQGDGVVPNARLTYVAPDGQILADSVNRGDGGRVIVWADGSTDFRGSISATGGAIRGDGGFAEVSGAENLGYYGIADLSFINGIPGTLLLDPTTILIEEAAASADDGFLAGGGIFANEAIGQTLTISDTALVAAAETGNLVLQAEQDIRIDQNFVIDFPTYSDTSITFLAENGSFLMNPDGTFFTRGRDLNIQAGNNIVTGIILANDGPGGLVPVGSENSGNVILTATNDITVNYIIARSNTEIINPDTGLLTGVGSGLGGSIVLDAGGDVTVTGSVLDGLNTPNPVAIRTSGQSGTGRIDYDGDGNIDAVFIRANSINIPNGQISSFANTDPDQINNATGGATTLISNGDIGIQGINLESGRIESDGTIEIVNTFTVSNDDDNLYAINTRTEDLILNASQLIIPDNSIVSTSLILANDLEIRTASGVGSIPIIGDINSLANEDHALLVSDDFSLQGNIGNDTPLTSLGINGSFDFQGNEITTLGEQNYQDLTTFSSDTQLTGSTVSFSESINNESISLEIIGNAEFSQDVTLNTLIISGITNTNTSNINTTGLQTYGDAVVLNGDTTFNTNGGDITVEGSTNGSHNLTVNAGAGQIRFAEAIGDINPLNNATFSTTNILAIECGLALLAQVDITAGQLDLGGYIQVGSGDLDLAAPIRLIKDTTLEATTGAIQLGREVTSPTSANNLSLSANNNITTQSITTNGGALDIRSTTGTITIGNLSTAATTDEASVGGSITLDNLVLTDDLLLTSGGGTVDFLGTVDGNHNLTVNADSGNIAFNNTIGNTTPLANLSLNNTGTITLPTQTTLSGTFNQANASSVSLGGTLTADSTITFNSLLQLTEATTITTNSSGDINLAAVTQTQPTSLTATASNNLTATNITLDQVNLSATNALTIGEITTTGTTALVSTNSTIDATSIDGTAITAISNDGLTVGSIAATETVTLTSTTGAIDVDEVSGTNVAIATQTDIDTGAIDASGTVNLTSSAGTITTSTVAGTDITATSNGDLNTGAIATTGTINLSSTTGTIATDTITGTDITITTPTTITTNDITANGRLDLSAGGTLTLGAIATTAGASLTTTTGDITTTTINNSGSTLQIQTGDGAIATNNITSPGADVNLQATNGITTNRISTSPTTGDAGNITLNTTDGSYQISRLVATSDNGNGGDILFDSAVELTDDLRIRTNGGTVQFSQTVANDNDALLAIRAGDGTIDFQGRATLDRLTLDTSGELIIANGLRLNDTLNFPAADRTRLGGRISIGQGDIEIPSRITLLDRTWIVAEDGAIALSQNIRSNSNEGNDLTLRARNGDITTENITTTGDISLFTRNNDITVGDITTAGNAIALIANGDTTAITTGDLTTSDTDGGGAVTVQAGFEITTDDIDTSATTGDGGNVSLDPTGDVVVGSINTQSEQAAGGDIEVRTQSFFRATNAFIANPTNGTLGDLFASLSALGATEGGDITIFHDGGAQLTPFNIANLEQNGTVGAIVSGTTTQPNIIPSGESYLGPYTQASDLGTIALITDPVLTPFELDTDEETQRDDGRVPTASFGLEEYFTGLFEAYFPQLASTRIKSLDEIQETLRQIEAQTGVRSAVLYAFFAPDGAFDLWTEVENIRPGMFSLDRAGWLNHNLTAAETEFLQEEFGESALLSARIPQNDRLGLVLVMPNAVEYVDNSPVTRGQAEDHLWEFRGELFKADTPGRVSNYQPFAEDFYGWLISDGIEAASVANGIEHISFVLDHELRGVPIAALHNPERDRPIIEDFSVGLMPSFSLTDTRYVPFAQSQMLAMGTDEFDDELGALPAVPFELNAIDNLDPDHWDQVWLFPDNDFTPSNLRMAHQTHAPEAIHLATHAGFNDATPDQSYLHFANGDRLSLSDLREFGFDDPPVNLMLLSACQTANGSEKAELGFVGVAAQSRITSVLGSLWDVDDWATSMLMIAFHHTLIEAGLDPADPDEEGDAMTKAIALQRVQQAIVNGEIFLESNPDTDTHQMVWAHPNGERDLWPIPDDMDTASLRADIENQRLAHPLSWSSFVVVGSPW